MSDRPPSGTRQIDGQEEQDNGKERELQRIRMAQRRIEAERQKAERLERAKTEYALKRQISLT